MKTRPLKLLYITVLLVQFFLPAQGQEGALKAFLPTEVGSHGHINDLLKTSDGFLWIATQEGLFRYDGYQLLAHRPNPRDSTSIPNAFVWTLFEDQQQQLWVGTFGSGLARYDRKTGHFTGYRLPTEVPESQSIHAIAQGPDNQLWLGTKQGIWRYDSEANSFSSIPQPTEITLTIINEIHFLDDEHMLVAAQEGAFIFQTSEEEWQAVINDRGVAAIDTLAGQTWLGSYNGLLVGKYNKDLERIEDIEEIPIDIRAEAETLNKAVSSLLIDKAGMMWIGTLNGLYVYDWMEDLTPRRVETAPDYELTDYQINTLLQIEPGLVGVGTRQGLHSLSNQPPVFHHLSTAGFEGALCSDIVLGCTEDEAGNWWLGTQEGLLKLSFHSKNDTILPYPYLRGECISPTTQFDMPEAYVINTRSFGDEHWVTFWRGGLRKLQSTGYGQWQFDSIPGLAALTQNAGIHDIIKDQAGSYWIATPNRGVIQWLPALDSLRVYEPKNGSGLLSPYIFYLLEDRQGRLWAGTANGGLCYREPGQDTFQCFTQVEGDIQSLSNNLVLSIYEDEAGTIWACTAGGLNRWLGDGTFEQITTADGLPSDIVYGMLEAPNSNDYWLSTNNGLVCIKPSDDKWDMQVFQAADGLQANEFNQYAFFRTQQGILCFGGPEGLTYFDPQKVGVYAHTAPVVLTDFQLFNQSQDQGKVLESLIGETNELRLKYDQNFLAFEFAALGYTQSTANTYAYQMVGVDEDWVYAGTRRYASYPQMQPGEYTFRVKAANHDGIWGEDIRELQIIISPPWWQRWWAFAIYFLALTALIFFIFQTRLRALRQIDQARQREREDFRKRTARDFHDEAGNKITKMSLLTEVIKRQTDSQSEQQPLLEQLEQSIQDLRLGMRDFIWVLDPQNDNLYDTLLRVKVFGQELFEHSVTLFNFPNIPQHWAQYPLTSPIRRHLLLISKEALHNCLQHAEATVVNISLTAQNQVFQLTICDDGKGVSVGKERQMGNGLRNMQERAQKIRAKLEISAAGEGGTCVKLQLGITHMED
ncbi:MAG: two-component regulator propeller domain-containing protein [Bacteroidota bacterium]